MEFNLALRNYSENIINGQVPFPVELTEIPDRCFGWDCITDKGHYIALINEQHLRRLNLRKPVVNVYPIHPKKGYDRSKKPTTFMFQETKTRFLTFYQNSLTKPPELRECIGTSSSWFEEEKIYTDKVEAVIWSIILYGIL